MKKFLFLILFLGFHLCLQAQAPDTIQVNIVANDTIGACLENQFVASFNADSLHRISIEPLLDFDGDSVNSCLDSINHPQVFLVLDSSSLPVSFQVLDTSTGKWTATITGTGLCTLYYHIYIDCSVILTTNTLTLSQVWTDSLSYVYLVDGNIDTSASIVVEKPHLLDIGPSSFSAIFLDTLSLTFMYKNTNLGTANILARFFPDSSNYCSSLPPLLPPLGFFYRIGKNGTPNSYVPGTEIPITLYTSDTLIFEELVIDSLCVYCDTVCTNNKCTRDAVFKWKCNIPPAISNVFCNDCQNVYTRSYNVVNVELHQVKVELDPASLPNIDNDKSCLNDTTFLQWDYIITNPGISAIDSLKLSLEYFGTDLFPYLTLIPTSTFSVVSNCSNCILTTNSSLRDSALCTNLVPDPLRRAWSSIKHFHPGDTVWVSFSTFRCGVENDTALLNMPKSFNQWRLYVNGITVCGDKASIIHSTPIGSSTTNGKYNLDLKLQFIPSITDLSVPAGATFGDSARFEIESKSIVTSVADFQLFGAVNTSKTSGWMRATIHCERGLVVQNRESEVYFQYFDVDSNKNIIIEPKFYHASIPLNFCDTGNYFFYFDLGDTLMLKAINGGEFIFNLQACCNINSNPAATDFEIKFHLIPNPDSCFNLTYTDTAHLLPPNCTGISCDAWIPLSSSASRIFTHCPGCLAPGIIVQDYKMKRISFGLQDSNNDGLADNSFAQIMNPSPWFTSHENDLIQHFSSYGDQLEDKMTAYFQDGDSSSGGYNYIQLRNIGLTLPFLQLSRIIPAGLDTMKAFPLEFTFYIDSIMSPSNCIDCDGFSLDTSITRTLYKLNVSGANLNQYLDVVQNENRLLFTFDGSIDSLNQLIGNLGSNSPYIDSTYSFKGFFEGQRYRLKVRYANCGNFIGENVDNTTLESAMIKSEITNKMWLCGAKQDQDSLQMHNTVAELQTLLNITIDPNNTLYQLMDTSYTNNRLFYCESFGGVHYFFTQEARNYSKLAMAAGCEKHLTVEAYTENAGFERLRINIYPFEYRPPMLWPKSYEINVPSGYYISQSKMRHAFWFINDPNIKFTNWVTFDLIDSIGKFMICDSTLSPPVCFSDTSYPIAPSDTNLYVKSNFTLRTLQFTLSPLSCDSNSNVIASSDSMAIIKFGNQNISCVDSNSCSITEITRKSNLYNSIFTLLPNLVAQTAPTTINVIGDQICITLNLSNFLTEISDGVNSTTASNVFLALPDSLSVPFLHNWVYYSPDTIYPSGQIIQIDTLFDVNQIDTGILCASLINCNGTFGDSATFAFHTGWNCGGFPSSPFDADSVCGATPQTITLIKSSASLSNSGKSPVPNTVYSLCDTIIAEADFVSTGGGYLYPTFVNLDSIPRGMGVLSVYLINNETDTDSVFLTYNNTTQNYPIDTAQMSSLNFPNHAFNSGQSIKVKALLIPTCEYTSDSLPQIEFYALDYCDSLHDSPATFQGSIDIVGSKCSDCFKLNKTASDSIIAALDTMSFNIEICANNQDSGFVYIHEYLPPNFVNIDTLPWYIITPAIGCTTLVVHGYFTQSGDCNVNENFVQINYSGFDSLNVYFGPDSLLDSACVTVTNACIDGTEIIMQNGGFASSGNFQSIYSGAKFYVEGTFTIDMDMTFNQCEIIAAPGSQIIIQSGYSLTIDSLTSISGCDSMWQRILMQEESRFFMFNNSTLEDANVGLEMADYCNVQIDKSSIVNCVKSVLLPLHPSSGIYSLQEFSITSSRFGLFKSFKPDYLGQPSHGNKPNIGIELNDVVASIGSLASDSNWIYNCNVGVLGFRAHLSIQNTYFSSIKKDAFYQNHYGGSAQAILGDYVQRITSSLDVNPLASQGFGVQYSDRAVYSDYASLEVAGCKMNNLIRGVEATNCPSLKQTVIASNEIYASQYGVYLHDNLGAKLMYVANNKIIVQGDRNSIAMFLDESSSKNMSNYKIEYNTDIRIIDGSHGVFARNLGVADISCNTINQIGAGVPPPLSNGIQLSGCNKVVVKSNNIFSTYSNTLGITRGVAVDVSTNSTISCNYIFNQYHGVLFGGVCGGTDLRGNTLHNNFEGLHLNSNAEIGLQINKGNEFIGNFDTTSLANFNGANNENNVGFGLQASRINVHVNMGTLNNPSEFYFPKIPLSNFSFNTLVGGPYFANGTSPSQTDWFVRIAGTPFLCPDYCSTNITGSIISNDDYTYEELIAMDSTQTVDFDPESRSMSNRYLYEKLHENDSLLQSDTLYSAFEAFHAPTCIGRLHEVGQLTSTAIYDSAYTSLTLQLDSIINSKLDSIQLLDSLTFIDRFTDYSMVRESLLSSFEFYAQLFSTLEIQKQVLVTNRNIQAQAINYLITPQETPELNQILVNEALLDLEVIGVSTVSVHSSNISVIAQQCPYSGGAAVFQARWYVHKFINDSIEYDDKATCLTQGIYRLPSNTSPSTLNENFDFSIAPNPNNGVFELKFSSEIKSTAKIEILNSYHQLVDVIHLPAGLNFYSIDLKHIVPAVYFVQYSQLPHIRITKKMVLIK